MRPLGIVLLLAGWTAVPSAAAEPAPWAARVPALPTGCYQSDGYAGKLSTAKEAVKHDIEQQTAINQQLKDQVKSADKMELVARQQQYMMDHPQEAMALMQRTQTLGTQESNDARLALLNEQQTLEEDLDGIDARYKAALAAAFAPIKAKLKDLDERAKKDIQQTEAGDFYKPWAVQEWNALNQQRNAAYEKVGAEWWAASGPFHGWLKRYREHLDREIAQREEADQLGAGFMVIMAGTPKASFKSTASLDATVEYIEQVGKVFGRRWEQPAPSQTGIESGGTPALK